MTRGGRRSGAAGKVYQNRSDMTAGASGPAGQALPVTAATGQPYGQAGAQRAAQAAVPMMSAPVAGASPAPPGGGPGVSPGTPPMSGLPPGIPLPGSMPPLDAPTNRPDEHFMTGNPAGGGAGLSALSPMVAHPIIQAAATLNSIPNPPPQVKALMAAVNATMANQGAV